jgi:hypothetical protein
MHMHKHECEDNGLFAFIRVYSRLMFLVAVTVLSLTGCGYVGNPQPPTLDMPLPITDLRVAEYGDRILTEFTLPPLTTEGLPLKSVRSVELRIGVAPTPFTDEAWAASAQRFEVPATGPGPLTHWVPADEVRKYIGKTVIIRARATGPKGKTSDWSNIKQLPVEPPLATPAELTVLNQPAGLYVTWKSSAKHFRVYQVIGDAPPELRGEPTDPDWQETNVEFGVKYKYYVQAVAGEYQQSDMAESQPKLRVDEFTPAVPTGLTGQQSSNSIELSWDRNTDPRFQGYNVFRSVDGGPFEKIASLIIAPTLSDRPIEIGKRYAYRISAVGTNGQESEQSAPYAIVAQ